MIEEIKQLEALSSALEPERLQITRDVLAYAEKHLASIYETKTYYKVTPSGAGFKNAGIQNEGQNLSELLNIFQSEVMESGIKASAHGHLGYIPGGGLYASALGDFLAAITNDYAGVFFASPGAVRMENQLIDWMADLVGYPASSAGNLSSGGSIANLTAIVTARDAYKIRSADIPKVAIYCTAQMHHCLLKAIRIAGLSEAQLQIIGQDDRHRMKPELLEEQIRADRSSGLRPWLVIASAGTTDVGAIDPLEPIGKIAKKYDCWYHIDAAYGGFFKLVENLQPLFMGMELSDSIVLDPHKGLFLPFGTGALLVKDRQHLLDSHHYLANYMQDTHLEDADLSPADLSPELSKHFRGLRMWLPLKLHGLAPFKAALSEKIKLSQYFYGELAKISGIEMGPYPELSIFYWRYIPAQGDADSFNAALLEEILKDGRVFMSSTTLDNVFLIRAAVLSFRTHLQTIDLALQIIREKIEAVKGSTIILQS